MSIVVGSRRLVASRMFGALVMPLVTACTPGFRVTTEVTVRSPADVDVRDPLTGAHRLAPTGFPARATIASGELGVDPVVRSRYRVWVERGVDRALHVHMAGAPSVQGASFDLVKASGAVVPVPRSALSPVRPSTELSIALCGRMTLGLRGRWFATVAEPCDARSTYGVVLATPWSNVVEVREVARVERGLAQALTFVVGPLLAIGGLAPTIYGATASDADARTVPLAIGIPLMSVGVLLFAASSRILFAPDRSVVLYPTGSGAGVSW